MSRSLKCPVPTVYAYARLSGVNRTLQVSKWIKTADLAKLEHAVYQGKASYLRGRTAWNEDIRNFLITAPNVAVRYPFPLQVELKRSVKKKLRPNVNGKSSEPEKHCGMIKLFSRSSLESII